MVIEPSNNFLTEMETSDQPYKSIMMKHHLEVSLLHPYKNQAENAALGP